MSRTITETTVLTVIECVNCGMLFAFSEAYEKQRRRDHAWFYCPQGHLQHYPGETDADNLRSKLLAAESERDFARKQRDLAEANARRLDRKAKALERKAAHGVCPHCKRTFTDSRLARHIATKHPKCEP
jgi:ribosomal protein L44E